MLRPLSLLAAIVAFAVPAVAAEQHTVRVQLVRSTGQAPYYIAVGKGYFTAEGIKIESGDIRSALDTIGPLARDQLDVSMGAATAGFFNAAHQGFDLRIVAALGVQGPVMATQPLIRKAIWDAGTIRSAKDYRGHKIAINAPGDVTEYFLTLMARKYGLARRDLDITPLRFSEQIAGFKNGAIDAGFLPEPLSTVAQLAGAAVRDEPDIGIGQGTLTTFAFFGTHFMQQHHDVALAFMRALVRGARDAQGDYLKYPAIAASIASQMNLAQKAVAASVPYKIDPALDITKYEASLRAQEAVHRENGRLSYDTPLAFDKLIDAGLVHEVASSFATSATVKTP